MHGPLILPPVMIVLIVWGALSATLGQPQQPAKKTKRAKKRGKHPQA